MAILSVPSEEIDSALDAVLNGTLITYPNEVSTSGASYISDKEGVVAPTANSTLQANLIRQRLTYNSAFNITSGGWLTAGIDIVDTAGVGAVDKIVARQAQINPTGGNVTVMLGFEAAIGNVGASTLVGNFVANYVPDLSAVANIANVQNFWSFSCDHYDSMSRNAGQTMQSMNPLQGSGIMQELAPMHGGVATGRYYMPYSATGALTSVSVVGGVQYFIPFVVPERTTYTEIGLRVTSAVGGSNMKLGVYHAENGVATDLIFSTADISTGTNGAATAVISESLEAGFYWLSAFFSAGVFVNHTLIAQMSTLSGQSADDVREISPYFGPNAYGALPAIAGYSGYSTTDVLPAVWLRK